MLFIADNLNVASEGVRRALAERDGPAIARLAEAAAAAGCDALDLNLGFGGRGATETARWLVRELAVSSELELVIDSANPEVIRAALEESSARGCRMRPVVNSFSLDDAKLERILPLAAEFDTEIIGYCVDGPAPQSEEERLSTAVELMRESGAAGIPPEKVYLDPILFPLTAAQEDLGQVVTFFRELGAVLDPAPRTIVALSNVSYGLPEDRRGVLEAAVLLLLTGLGLDGALVNPARREVRNAIGVVRALELGSVFSPADIEPPPC